MDEMELGGQVLVLNQDYQPITICSVKKGIALLFLGKVEVLHVHPDRKIRTVSKALDFPTVIRLLSYVRIPYKKIVVTRKNILKRDGYRCQYCGTKESLTIDHVLPRSRGGKDTWENLVTCCSKCNVKKGNKTPQEANMPLFIQPYKPNHIFYLRAQVNKVMDDWKPYLYL